jgi:predicted lipoprotein with Yx(FWY)xxD motif
MVPVKLSRHLFVPVLLGAFALLAVTAVVTVSPVRAAGHAASPSLAPVKTTSARVLVSSKGRTLYVFAADSANKSACYGSCAKFWPPQLVPAGKTVKPKVAGLRGTFGVITRKDGTRQLTYDGAPLYTFSGDTKAGQMDGQGLNVSGGYWWMVVA